MIVGIISINAKPKKSKQFVIMLPTNFEVIDDTEFKKESSRGSSINYSKILSYTEDDIKLSIKESDFSCPIECYTLIENDVILDTIVTAELKRSIKFNDPSYQKHKLKPERKYSEYLTEYYASNRGYGQALSYAERVRGTHLSTLKKAREYDADQKRMKRERAIADSIEHVKIETERKIDKFREARNECERLERVQQYMKDRIAGTNLNVKAGELRTETGTNPLGAKITYTYYVDDNGNKVKHGIFKASRTYNNEYRNNINDHTTDTYISAWFTGSESSIVNYQHGVIHGSVTLNVDVSIQSNQLGTRKIVKNESMTVYNGMIDGNFKYTYNGKKISGKASKGILDWIEIDGNTIKRYEFPKKENYVLQANSFDPSYLNLEGLSVSSGMVDLPYVYGEKEDKTDYRNAFYRYNENPCEYIRIKENYVALDENGNLIDEDEE